MAMTRSLLVGDAFASSTLADDASLELVNRRVRAELSHPGMRLRVLHSAGNLVPEQRMWADLFDKGSRLGG